MDFRFVRKVRQYAERVGLEEGTYDLVCIRGGAGNFDSLRAHLETSRDLHAPREVHLLIHEACGYRACESDLVRAEEIASEVFDSMCVDIFKAYLPLSPV